ncbi:MAG: MoaD/ThiS family protein [Acidimicrobiales bacterium]|nr:MoaD/ThiS family protein [Acidimicrobiales bacterium]
MATVHLQDSHTRFTDGEKVLDVDGATISQVIDALEAAHPGLGPLLREGSSFAVNGELQPRGTFFAPVPPDADVHFLIPITGG